MNKKLLIIILVFIVILAGLSYFVYLPQTQEIISSYQSYLEKKDKLEILEAKKSNLDKLKQQKEEVKKLLAEMQIYLPESKEAGNFLVEIEALGNATLNTILEIKFSEEKTKTSTQAQTTETAEKTQANASPTSTPTTDSQTLTTSGLKTLVFDLKIEGTYKSVTDFINNLKSINRYNTIDSATLELVGDKIQSSIQGKIYYKKS